MLIGIRSILGPELLYALRAMGHGDEIALVDGNYPAQEHARRLVRADGHRLIPLLDAVLSVLPIDLAAPHAICRASLNGDPTQAAAIHGEIDRCCASHVTGCPVKPLAGEEIYPRIRAAHTVVATGEPELFANVILRKGVIAPSVAS